jgi:hypothetical protein
VPYANPDDGYYNGWTGGIFAVTEPVRGSDLDLYETGNNLCKMQYGNNAIFAEFHDGLYMDYMNTNPQKTWKNWEWAKSKCGAISMWGYFNIINYDTFSKDY